MKVSLTIEDGFTRHLKTLPPDRQKRVKETLKRFMAEPTRPSLNFRALAGAPGYFIVNGSRGDRVILRKNSETDFSAVDTGPHDNVYRRWNR